MSLLHSLTITRRLGLLIASSIAGIVFLSALFLWTERSMILEERKQGVQQSVESVHGLLAHFHHMASSGSARAIAQPAARAPGRAMRAASASADPASAVQ